MNCAPRKNKKNGINKNAGKKINIPSLEVELQELSIAFFSFNVSLMRQNSSFAQTLGDKNKVRRSPLVLSNQAWQSREKLRCLVAFVEGPQYFIKVVDAICFLVKQNQTFQESKAWEEITYTWRSPGRVANYLKTRIF